LAGGFKFGILAISSYKVMIMHPILNIAVRAARKAGNHIKRSFERLDEVKITAKGQNDFVTDVDQKSELIIIETLSASYPDHGFLGEEYGEKVGDEHTWIIDPIDGTTNFIHGYPHFCISLALKIHDRIEHALIYDPIRDDLYTATRGSGAFLNEHRIRVKQSKTLSESLVGLSFSKRHLPKRIEGVIHEIAESAGGIRRGGSAALDLAYVAAGRLDASYQFGMKLWDIAAGGLIVSEAGGLVQDTSGKDYLQTGHLVASNLRLMPALELLIKAAHDD
jgi:myo-inositol-1(or 4)-monophosphatase